MPPVGFSIFLVLGFSAENMNILLWLFSSFDFIFLFLRFVLFVCLFVYVVLLLFFNLRRKLLFHYSAVPFVFLLFAAIWTSVDCR